MDWGKSPFQPINNINASWIGYKKRCTWHCAYETEFQKKQRAIIFSEPIMHSLCNMKLITTQIQHSLCNLFQIQPAFPVPVPVQCRWHCAYETESRTWPFFHFVLEEKSQPDGRFHIIKLVMNLDRGRTEACTHSCVCILACRSIHNLHSGPSKLHVQYKY